MGLKLAIGKYIARMDSDDISLATRLEKQVQFLDKNIEIILCGTWFQFLNKEKSIISYPTEHGEITAALLSYCSFGHPTVMFRKEIFSIHGLSYDKSMEPAEDYNLWVDLSKIGKLANIGEVLLQYRIHRNQVSKKKAEQQNLNSRIAKMKMLSRLNHNFRMEDLYPETNSSIKQLEMVSYNFMQLEEINSKEKVFDTKLFKNSLDATKREAIFDYFISKKHYNLTSLWLLLKTSTYRECFTKKTLIKICLKCIIRYKNWG